MTSAEAMFTENPNLDIIEDRRDKEAYTVA